MRRERLRSLVVALVGLFALQTVGQTPVKPSERGSAAPLSGEEVVQRMVRRNLERAKALRAFHGTRVYRIEYQGVLGNRAAEMVADVAYQAPSSKEFKVISQSGSKLIGEHVLRKLLESEQEAMKAENRARNALNTDNYTFRLIAYEPEGPAPDYVLDVEPTTPSKYLYRGKIWVDAQDFAVSRMEVEPAKSPSFWTKKSTISHTYAKVEGFWLPKQNRSVSSIRFGGQAVLTIDYSNYKILDPVAGRSGSAVSQQVGTTSR